MTNVREQLVKLLKQGMAAKALKDFEGQLAGAPRSIVFTAYRGPNPRPVRAGVAVARVRELGGIV